MRCQPSRVNWRMANSRASIVVNGSDSWVTAFVIGSRSRNLYRIAICTGLPLHPLWYHLFHSSVEVLTESLLALLSTKATENPFASTLIPEAPRSSSQCSTESASSRWRQLASSSEKLLIKSSRCPHDMFAENTCVLLKLPHLNHCLLLMIDVADIINRDCCK